MTYINLSICLSVCLFVCLCVCLSVYQSHQSPVALSGEEEEEEEEVMEVFRFERCVVVTARWSRCDGGRAFVGHEKRSSRRFLHIHVQG